MKTKWITLALMLLLAAPLGAASVSFPAGNFENGTAALWMPATTGTATATTPSIAGNIVGEIGVTGTGTGSLSTSVPAAFQPQSLYVISVGIKTASLAGTSSQLGVAVLDGDGNTVKALSQDQLLNALGIIDLGLVNNLTSDLAALTGKLDLTARLQSLLSLLDGDPVALDSIQTLIDSLAGADSSTLAAVSDLLQNVLDGTVDPATLTQLQLAQLLGLPEASPIVANTQDVLTSITGNDGVIEALQGVITQLSSNTGDVSIVNDLLTTLVGQADLTGTVSDILAYALSDTGLLGTLTSTLTQSLLGVTTLGGGDTHNVKLIFSTGTTPPSGAIGIRLSSGATLGVGQTADFDNVTIDRFDFSNPVTPPTISGVSGVKAPPALTVKGKQVRRGLSKRQVIRGTASAFPTTGAIARVEYRLKGAGGKKNHSFHKAKGTNSWKIVVRPKGNRVRVIIRAVDVNGQYSESKKVFIEPQT